MSTTAKILVAWQELDTGTIWIGEERAHCRNGVDPTAPPGLGRFAYLDAGSAERTYRIWLYRPPNRSWRVIDWRHREPPPLPRPDPRRARCCAEAPHRCQGCGLPYWIELHGLADGYCTYCWHCG